MEKHQILGHKNSASSLNGYIGCILLPKIESNFSESSPFTLQENRFWPSVLENNSLAGILVQGAASFQGA